MLGHRLRRRPNIASPLECSHLFLSEAERHCVVVISSTGRDSSGFQGVSAKKGAPLKTGLFEECQRVRMKLPDQKTSGQEQCTERSPPEQALH